MDKLAVRSLAGTSNLMEPSLLEITSQFSYFTWRI
jgi:hypothetical protein